MQRFVQGSAQRSAFTLLELLVVIAIIGVLVAIALPAINYSREAARRGQCVTRQRDLALALIAYATENKGLPGYINEFGVYRDGTLGGVNITNQRKISSWVVSILPMLGENKRYEFLTKDALVEGEVAQATVDLPSLVCPAANNGTKLNYVVNCGPADFPGAPNSPGATSVLFSLFRDRRAALVDFNKKFAMDEIPDGTSNTVLLSENLQAGEWYYPTLDTEPDPAKNKTLLDALLYEASVRSLSRSNKIVQNLGFVWSNRPKGSSAFYSKINDGKDAPASFATARPSSNHPGVVGMAYADGSAKPMNDDVGRGPYLKAVCPDDSRAVQPPPTSSAAAGLGYAADDFNVTGW
jgi:prepilin-type N-terminal cleavage/methylation domain-containing protein